MSRVCHLSSAHQGEDVRIFHKQCASLAAAGYDTHLVISANANDVVSGSDLGFKVHPLKMPVGRFARMLKQAWITYRIGHRINADVYHFHDPELILYGMLFVLSGKKVIYDVHEDVPQDILTKEWITPWARKVVSAVINILENFGARFFFNIVAATPLIAQRFKKINPKSININNYPKLGELDVQVPWCYKAAEVCYVGSIGRIRGIQEVIQALTLTQSEVRLNLCGSFSEPDLEQICRAAPGWQKVNVHGFVGRQAVREVLGRSLVGLVTLHPVINYLDALPVKMFEYMAAGIPVIASDFPLWRDIVVGNHCGLCVDPMDPAAIAQAIDYLVKNPDLARQMGENGRRAVLDKYNWSEEEAKLLDLYRHILLR
jgi:glycosyltransferase involved in cell wall biosynthesis